MAALWARAMRWKLAHTNPPTPRDPDWSDPADHLAAVRAEQGIDLLVQQVAVRGHRAAR